MSAPERTISKLLVANRGEIAARVLRSAAELGIATVAVYGLDDQDAPHVALADEAVRIGDEREGIPYLKAEALLEAARRTGADAIHPGYGFLAENPAFARAVNEAGLVWVGPQPEVMEAMAQKDDAKARAAALAIPVVPGMAAEGDDEALVTAAAGLGYPLLVKAVAGGGGRGMRVARDADALRRALPLARQEATQSFGDGRLLLERYVERGRHVEVQIFGDTHGHHLHLGERECSIQRRHQKLIEESPSPGISEAVRERLCQEAVRLVSSLGYVGAGTVEFLVDADSGQHYFLEVNARIQVEHPVTELVTGLDLVAWQLLVAEGRALPCTQDEITFRGHAIEVRLCAEDPADDHRPQAGPVGLWRPPAEVRVDAAFAGNRGAVSMHYDSMVAKLIAWAPDRVRATRKLDKALADTVLLGLPTNRTLLQAVLRQPAWARGETLTRFLQDHDLRVEPAVAQPDDLLAVALHRHGRALQGRFRNNPHRGDVTVLEQRQRRWLVVLQPAGANTFRFGVGPHDDPLLQSVPEADQMVRICDQGETHICLERAGWRRRFDLIRLGEQTLVQARGGQPVALVEGTLLPEPQAEVLDEGSVRAPGAAVVQALHVAVGEVIALDQPLLTLEAMKMLTVLRAPQAGVVTAVGCAVGEAVAAGQTLVAIESTGEPG